MKVRKASIILIFKNKEQLDKVFDNILLEIENNELLTRVVKITNPKNSNGSYIIINRYKIEFRISYNDNARAKKPEITYIDYHSNIKIETLENIIKPQLAISTRKESLRFINFDTENINIQEILDDEYSLKETIDKRKNEFHNRIFL